MVDESAADAGPFRYAPVAGEPGWYSWDLIDATRFNSLLGPLALRHADDARAYGEVKMLPERRHSNLGDAVHGGVTLAFVDVALFAGSRALRLPVPDGCVTADLQCQFVAAGRIGVPMVARVELVRETRALRFLRGLVVQEDHTIASFTGLLRKGRTPA